MIRILICDDDPVMTEHLCGLVNQCLTADIKENATIYTSTSSFEALEYARTHIIDILLVDIELDGGKNGIHLASQICCLNRQTKVIYITGYGERYSEKIFGTQQSYRVIPNGYIVKPVKPDLLYDLLENTIKEIQAQQASCMQLRLPDGTMLKLRIDDIRYLESCKRMVTIHIRNQSEPFSFYGKLSEIKKQLPECFQPTHKSFLVNLNEIHLLYACEAVLYGGDCLPVSQTHRASVREQFTLYRGMQL